MNGLIDLTIAIPTKNEEKNIQGCLQAIGKNFAKHIVLLDSGSTDNTKLIAKDYGVEIVHFDWNGQFPKKRNWYLRNCNPNTSWILFLDADEYLTEDVKSEIRKSIQTTKFVGFWLNYSIHFLGRPLKGGYPLRKLALFKIGSGEYERIDETRWSLLDMEIHEHPILEGKTGFIKNKIDHRDFRGVAHYLRKHEEYADWEVNRFIKIREANFNIKFTFAQKLKYKLMATPFLAPVFFLGGYILLGGFRDGYRGFAFAILKAAYFTQIYCKVQEKSSVGATKI